MNKWINERMNKWMNTWCRTNEEIVSAAGIPQPIKWNNGDFTSSN